MKKLMMAAMIAAGFVSSGVAQAADGPLMVRGRILHMKVDNDNSTTSLVPSVTQGIVEADDKTFPEVDVTYFITKNIAAELILTYPQKHDVTLGGSKIGTVKHLPPTLTLQYHFLPEGTVRPYVGAGLNYTRFMSVDLDAGRAQQLGGAGGIPLEVKRNSFGLAGQLGVDFKVADNWFVNVDVKYVKIETEVKVKSDVAGLGGTKVTDLGIDPWLFSVGVGYRF